MKRYLKKKGRVILSLLLALAILVSGVGVPQMEARAASFEDINQANVFIKQQTSITCTLASAVMMLRRAAILLGRDDWSGITEASVRPVAWDTSGAGGLYHSFTYSGISVSYVRFGNVIPTADTLGDLLREHPEGIVAYSWENPEHAVLLTDYTDGVLYCADPANTAAPGRIPLSSSYGTITPEKIRSYWYVSSPDIPDPETVKLTGNMAADLVAVAESQVGYTEGENRSTIYGAWFGNQGQAWGASFVAWCAYKAGIPESIIPKCKTIMSGESYRTIFGRQGRYFQIRGGANENCDCGQHSGATIHAADIMKGDLLLLENNDNVADGPENVAIVTDTYDGKSVTVVIGSVGGKVVQQSEDIGLIHGVCRPTYNTPDLTFTVTYDANNGSKAPASQTKKYGVDLTLSSEKPVRNGYSFKGWNTETAGKGTAYASGDVYSANEAVTLYAQWEKEQKPDSGVEMPPKAAEKEAQFTVQGGSAKAGGTVTVLVAIKNNPGIISLRNRVVYDTNALELVRVENLSLLKGYIEPQGLQSPHTMNWSDALASSNNKANGDIARLTFQVKKEAEKGDYGVVVQPIDSYTATGQKVDFAAAGAYVNVTDKLPGDVDGNGEITGWDGILLNRYLAGWAVSVSTDSSDVDGNGEVTGWDAILLDRYLAGWDIVLK